MDQRKTVYFAYVQSVLQYGVLAWGYPAGKILETFETTQRTKIKDTQQVIYTLNEQF